MGEEIKNLLEKEIKNQIENLASPNQEAKNTLQQWKAWRNFTR